MVNSHLDPQLSGRHSSDTSATIGTAPQRAACERCRGQKLRCTRAYDAQAACNRCERAGAQCIVSPVLRVGRPIRLDPSSSRQQPSNDERDRSGASRAPHELPPQTSRGLDDMCLPLSAPNAPSPQTPTNSAHQKYMNANDGFAQDLDLHDADLFGLVSLSGEEGEGTFDGSTPSPVTIDLSQPPSDSYMTCLNLQGGIDDLPLDPALTAGHQKQAQNGPFSSQKTVSTEICSEIHGPN
ncbi:MAG: hypothetical protein L6R39_004696 [Caloplaca ligustica]|nr:MAG: hypothetical protein L6R39_004696 [Caloplaca ligustica]